MLVLCTAFIIVLIVLGIRAVYSLIDSRKPQPTPTPVGIVTELGETVESSDSVSESSSFNDVPYSPLPSKTYAELPPASEQNDILYFLESSASDKKVCYLTFDDGPNNSVTIQTLDVLRRYNVKATFFQVGSLVAENPDVTRRIYEEGHLIANHSNSHNYKELYANSESFMNEYNMCRAEIANVIGDNVFPLMRFPGGSFDSGTYGKQKQEYKAVLAQSGVYCCDWNCLSGDAESGKKTANELIERIKSSSKNKNQVVVLMHDASSKKHTAEALPQIIEYFKNEGFVFSRLDKPILQ